ncbi:MAG: hypothetical protein AAGF15_05295 [Pseudomonadota bacterium]
MAGSSGRNLKWWELAKRQTGLSSDQKHPFQIQRESIPIVLVPGIMGSKLRKTSGKKSIFSPTGDIASWIFLGPSSRRRRLLGKQAFTPSYLEPKVEDGDKKGWSGLFTSAYAPFLEYIEASDFGKLAPIFSFPAYAAPYNWTASNKTSGEKLAARVDEVMSIEREAGLICDRAIILTHSMGGLVTRGALANNGLEGKSLGVIHTVMPTVGAPQSYVTVKKGGSFPISIYQGGSPKHTVPLIGNAPGPLELLPTNDFRTNDGDADWLKELKDDGKPGESFPKTDDVYSEIYLNRKNLERLLDPDLLGAGYKASSPRAPDPWDLYVENINVAKSYHAGVGMKKHATTALVYGKGTGHKTYDRVEFEVGTPNWFMRTFVGAPEERMEIEKPKGSGDGTVPEASAAVFEKDLAASDVLAVTNVEHQPALNNGGIRTFILTQIKMMAEAWRDERLSSS